MKLTPPPDLPRRQTTSAVHDLAWTLIFEGDLTAIQPLQDALRDDERYDDLRQFNRTLSLVASDVLLPRTPMLKNNHMKHRLGLHDWVRIFWFDLFDTDATIDALAVAIAEWESRPDPATSFTELPLGGVAANWEAPIDPNPAIGGSVINSIVGLMSMVQAAGLPESAEPADESPTQD